MAMRQYFVYILTSRSGVLYVGMTNDLHRRMIEHKNKLVPGFTAKYNVDRLVWYEDFPTAWQAIAAEKRVKGWSRAKKIALIEATNPEWEDLAASLGEVTPADRGPSPARDVSLRST